MIYFCVPTYNEEHTVGVVLWKLRQVMAEFQRDYQVLLVDDASTDATPDVLEPYTRIMPLHIRRNESRQGYGTCLEEMLTEAARRSSYLKRDCAVVLQADFTEEPADAAALIRRIEGGADIVAGSARPETPHPHRGHGLVRRIAGYVLGRLPLPENAGDPLVGLRAYRLIVLKKAMEAEDGLGLRGLDGPVANARLLQVAVPQARRVEEIEVRVRYDRRLRESRFSPLRRLQQLFGFALGRSGRNGGTNDESGSGTSGYSPAHERDNEPQGVEA